MNFNFLSPARSAASLRWFKLAVLLLAVVASSGCETSMDEYVKTASGSGPANGVTVPTQTIELRAGDVLNISFPGSPVLNTTQQIRRDGKISMSVIGDVMAAGKTIDQLKADLLALYSTQITSKEVNVVVTTSTFDIYVTGYVVKPGKVTTDHPMTALEAIMESGGFNYATADLRSVKVIRVENGTTKTYKLNLKAVLDGKDSQQFYMEPSDIIYVPERFNWF